MFLILNLDQSTGKLQQCEAKLGYRTCFTKLDLSKWLQYISLNWFKNGLDKIPSLDSFIQMIEGHLLSNSWSRGTSSHSGLLNQAARLPCGVREPCKLKKIFYFLSSHLLPQSYVSQVECENHVVNKLFLAFRSFHKFSFSPLSSHL